MLSGGSSDLGLRSVSSVYTSVTGRADVDHLTGPSLGGVLSSL